MNFSFDKADSKVVASAASVGTVLVPMVSMAADDNLTAITTMVTSLGTLAAAVTTVVIGAMVVRLGIKFVNRMTVKG